VIDAFTPAVIASGIATGLENELNSDPPATAINARMTNAGGEAVLRIRHRRESD
jgi:hypothetical protein